MRWLRAGVLVLGVALGLAVLCRTAADRRSAQTPAVQPLPAAQTEDRSPLFPALDGSGIQTILIVTPESRFEFHTGATGKVSVNGRCADAEVYQTLVSQIVDLPVIAIRPFTGDHELLLTLTIDTGSAQHTARFYDDGGTGEESFIQCGTQETPSYWQTDGWRVGTLMMTCEGTRIQDERGNETPAS